MENKEMKKTIPEELNDDVLDTISGGTAGAGFCPKCGNTLDENNLCAACNVLLPVTIW